MIALAKALRNDEAVGLELPEEVGDLLPAILEQRRQRPEAYGHRPQVFGDGMHEIGRVVVKGIFKILGVIFYVAPVGFDLNPEIAERFHRNLRHSSG